MNKKISFIILALLAASTLKAQTQKGSQLLGGSIGFSVSKGSQKFFVSPGYQYNTSSDSKTTSFGIGPNYSNFIADNLDLGVSGGFGTVKTTYDNINTVNPNSATEQNNRNYSASIYLRKYFLYNGKIGVRTGPFASYTYSSQRSKYHNMSNDVSDSKAKLYGGGLGLDLVFFPTSKLGFASTLGSIAYTHSNMEQPSNIDKSDSFGLNLISSGLTLSAFYVFGK